MKNALVEGVDFNKHRQSVWIEKGGGSSGKSILLGGVLGESKA